MGTPSVHLGYALGTPWVNLLFFKIPFPVFGASYPGYGYRGREGGGGREEDGMHSKTRTPLSRSGGNNKKPFKK